MRSCRLLFLVFAAVFALRHPLAAQAPPVFEDLRLLVRLEFGEFLPFIDDALATEIMIFRSGALRYSRQVFVTRDGCDSSRFALGKGTRAEVQAVEQALTAARVGQLTGVCHLNTSTIGEGGGEIRWTGPFGDRSNVISFTDGPTLPGAPPPPPPCTAELRDAHAAILAFAEAVLARPETSVIQGSACYPSQ